MQQGQQGDADVNRFVNSVLMALAIFILAASAPAFADGITIQTGWTPFLFQPYCSSCGPNTPLTLEQADAVEVLLGPAIAEALSPPLVGPDLVPVGPASTPTAGSAPTGSIVPGNLGAMSSGGSFGPHGLDVSSNRGGADDGHDVEQTDGLDYDVHVIAGHGHQADADADTGGAFNDDSPDHNDGDNPSHGTITITSDDWDNDTSSHTVVAGGGQAAEVLTPEPTSLLLFGSGLVLLASRLKRRSVLR